MGLLRFIKSLLGLESKKQLPSVYDPPFIVLPARQQYQSRDYWEQMKKRWDARMEWERQRRSRYGGF